MKKYQVTQTFGYVVYSDDPDFVRKIREDGGQDDDLLRGADQVFYEGIVDEIDSPKLYFGTVEEGLHKLQGLYATSEVVSGEFCDSIIDDPYSDIDSSVPLSLVHQAVEALREWDAPD